MDQLQQLIDAIKSNHLDQVNAIITAEPALITTQTLNGGSPILLAAYYGRKEIVAAMLALKPTLDLFEACAAGATERVKQIVAAQPESINTFAPDGFFPLGLAAFFGHANIAEYLLAHGADPNIAANNPQRVTALHAATASQSLAIVKMLIARGGDVNAKQINNFTPLHNAAQNGQIEMIELLLKNGANINAKSQDGKTPLAFALESKQDAAANYLREHGAI